ncbi:MAG TPA: serine/threonine-protein kinase [Kofleriaceae bacterium]|nr:serine/threonine-protein kinase [Kofleriaceae bacterium]
MSPHGASTVFRARDRETGNLVALKMLRGASPIDRERFANEAALLAGLAHEAIVPYVGHGTTQSGEPYLATAWIDGRTLRERLRDGAVPEAETVAILQRIAGALATMHARGVIHRDVKPSNVVLPEGAPERAVLIDLGIARRTDGANALTRTGVAVGSPGYMSPEQARADKQLDARSDVFSLGCLGYTCLAGTPPFGAEHVMATRLRVLLSTPARLSELAPSASAGLVALIASMMSKRPEARPADGTAVAAAIAELRHAPQRDPAGPESRSELIGSIVLLVGPAEDGAIDLADRSALVSQLPSSIALADGTLVVSFGAAGDAACRAARRALDIRLRIPGVGLLITRIPDDASADALDRLAGSLAASSIRGALTGIAPIAVDDAVAPLLAPAFETVVVDRLRVLELAGDA